jgi:hypothetical protein
MTKKYHYLYKTTNLINGKIYLGIHSTNNLNDGYIGNGIYSPKKALRDFKRKEKTAPFVNAVVKYGYDNFKREIINFFNSREELIKAEEEFVNEEWIKSENNYNVAKGGINKKTSEIGGKFIYQYSLEGLYIRSFKNIEEIRIYFNTSSNLATLYNVLNPKNERQITFKGYRWSFEKLENLPEIKIPKTVRKKVQQLTLKNEVINTFNTAAEFKKLGFDPSRVGKACRGEIFSYKGFLFKYVS